MIALLYVLLASVAYIVLDKTCKYVYSTSACTHVYEECQAAVAKLRIQTHKHHGSGHFPALPARYSHPSSIPFIINPNFYFSSFNKLPSCFARSVNISMRIISSGLVGFAGIIPQAFTLILYVW